MFLQTASLETIVEKVAHRPARFRERDQRATHIARRQTPYWSRSIPVDPPSSAMETIAARCTGYFFSAESTVNVPVPPPTVTIFFISVVG